MGRKPRIDFPGAFHHVSVRGNSRLPIFFTDDDRLRFLSLVAEGVGRFGYGIHAYCLMTNHAHFAIQVRQVPLWKIVHNLCFRYSRFVNRRLGRSGHLFERRYRARLIDSTSSLIRVVRYIHRNPVEAGMVDRAGAFEWSSHRAYEQPPAPGWLTTNIVMSALDSDRSSARDRLRAMVDSPGADPVEDAHLCLLESPGRAPTSRPRAANLESSLEAIVDTVVKVTGVDWTEVVAGSRRRPATRARALLALIVRDHSGFSLRELGSFLGRDASSLSCAASRWQRAPPDVLVAFYRDELAVLRLLRVRPNLQ